jgi:nucleoside-diphosphate-sugar epimerase
LSGVRNLIERFAHAKILFTSSTSVYAQTTGEWVTEESPAAPAHERGKILRDAEEMVVARSGIVARVGGIYGPGRSALLRKVLNGEAVVDPEHDRFANQVHRDDGAAALFLLLNRGSSTGEIYNVVDDQPVLQSECYRWLAGKLDRPAPPVGKSKLTRKRGQSNKRVSNAKLRVAGWSPRYPTFIEGMENSVLPNLAKLGA